MTRTEEGLESFLARIDLPVTKEELINGLLAQEAAGAEIALVERLPRNQYDSSDILRSDLDEISRVHGEEVAQASGYEDYLRLVVEHVGDVSHATKAAFNRTAEAVVESARDQGMVSGDEAARLRTRLQSEFARLRGSMTGVTDDSAPIDPRDDLPKFRE